MKNFLKSSGKFFAVIALMSLSVNVMAQQAGDHVTMSVSNCVQTGPNTMTVDLYIVNDGTDSLWLSTLAYGLNLNTAVLNGGTPSWTFSSGSSGLYSGYSNDFVYNYRATLHELQLTTGFAVYATDTAPTSSLTPPFPQYLPIGTPLRVGTFTITNSVNWGTNTTTSFTLQSVTAAGATNTGCNVFDPTHKPSSVSLNTSTYRAVSVTCSIPLNAPPSSPTASSNSPQCSGSTLNLTSSVGVGTLPLTYTWTGPNGFTSSAEDTSITGATAAASGTYTVTITNTYGSTSTTTAVFVDNPSAPSVSVTNNCGNSVLSTTSTGSLLWSTGATTTSITVTSSGAFTVTTTDGYSCTSPAGSGTAAPYSYPSTPSVNVSNSCGSSTLSTTAGGTLLWSTGAATSSITVTSGGAYTVTTTNGNGCTSSAGSGTAAPYSYPSTPSVTDVDHCGSSTLSTIAGGTLLWSTGATTTSITVTSGGAYTVTTTNGNGCTSSAGSGTAAPYSYPSAPSVTDSDACGSSTLSTTTGGSLLWSTGATTTSITVTAGGPYTVTTTNGNGCTSTAGSGTAAPYSVPSAPSVSASNTCGSSTLSTTSGGSLLWSTGATTTSITVTTPGSYTVTTTNGSGCTSTAGSGTAAPINIATPVVNDIDNCNGTSVLNTSATGVLSWSTGATSTSITVTAAGTYSVTATASGCTSVAGTGTATPGSVPSTPTATDIVDSCNGTSTLTAGSYSGTLLWNTGATTSSITVTAAGTYSVTQKVNGCTSLAGTASATPRSTPATPTVTVTNNCGNSVLHTSATGSLLWNTGATTTSITVTTAAIDSVTSTANGCMSASGTGTAAPSTVPGMPGITVYNNYNCTSGQTALVATGYTGTVHWSNGSTATVIVTSVAGTWTLYQTIGTCNSATVTAVAAPGTTPATPTVSVTNACGSSTLSTTATDSLLWTSGGATTTSITVTAAGSYSVTTTAPSGCVSAAGHNTAAPYAFPSAPVVTDVDNCNNTSTLTTTSTGTLLWSTGATSTAITVSSAGPYTVTTTNGNGCTSSPGSGTANPLTIPPAPTVSDSDGCTSIITVMNNTGTLLWNTGATTTSIVVAVAGTYSVTQRVSGCVSSPGTAIATPFSSPPPSVSVNNTCLSSTISATSAGALLWSTGATTTSITVSSAGTYSVTETGTNGCTSAAATATSAPIALPPTPTVSDVDHCGTSTLSTTSTGTLLWSTGATTSSIAVTVAGTYSVTTTVSGCASAAGTGTSNPTGLPPTPGITVYNNYNCTSGQTALVATGYTGTVHWSNGSTATVIVTSTAATWTLYQTVGSCNSLTASAVAAPGTTPATPAVSVTNACGSSTLSTTAAGSLLWTSGGATTTSITVTAAGSYSVTTTAASGCVSAAGHNTAAPYAFPSAPVVTDVDNCNNTSTLTTTSTGTLLWSTGATSAAITVSSAGPYTVTTTNGNGCTSSPGSGTANPLTTPPAPTVSDSDGCTSTITVMNNTGTLLWNTGATTASIVVAVAGTYSVTQTVSGCVSSPGTAMANPLSSLPPAVIVMNTCLSSTLSTTATGTLLWNTGATTTSITVSSAGTYSVTQTNLYGCTSASGTGTSAPIALPATPAVSVVNACGTSTLSTTSTGSLLWSTGATTSAISVTAVGTYSVITTSPSSGCTSLSGSGTSNPTGLPPTPGITVYNNYNCTSGQTALVATGYTGTVHWTNGSTATVLVTSVAATWTLYQTVGTCNSASATAVASPSTTPATPSVLASNICGSSTLSTAAAGSLLWTSGATTSSITATAAGSYSITTTNAGGCVSAAGHGTAAPLAVPAAPTVAVVNNCATSALSTASTGTLLWSTGATTTSIAVTAGVYTVTTTNSSGCTSSSGSGTASPYGYPAAPTVTNMDNCGNSTLTASNYSGNLLWSQGNATTVSITVTAAGTYSVTQTVSGCVSAAGTAASSPQAIPAVPSLSVTNNCDGTSTLCTTVTGGFVWSTGDNVDECITVTTAGTYSLTVTGNGCTNLNTGYATAASTPSPPTAIDIDNGCSGTSTITASSYTGTLSWNTGATTSSITVTVGGTYYVTQTVNGCTSLQDSAIASPQSPPSAPVVTVMNTCLSSTLSTTATGALVWSAGGATTTSITVSAAGTYSVTQTGLNGCTSASGRNTAAPIALPTAPTVSVNNGCGISTLSTTSTGNLLWSTGATTSSTIVTAAGTYSVTTTSASSGCTSLYGSGTSNPTSLPPTPGITVYNNYNCASGQAALVATGYTGTVHWSNGSTATVIVTATAATWTLYQTLGGCNSATTSAIAAPGTTPATPSVSVTNFCGGSTLSTTAAGSLLWTSGATTASITVTAAGSYSVTTTAVSGCVSAAGHNTAAPYTFPSAPVVTDVDNCNGTSKLSTTSAGALLWSTGATTTSVSVTAAGTYSVTTTTVNGCTSSVGTGTASPRMTPPTPSVTDTDACGYSILYASNYSDSLLWSAGAATTSSITVTTAGTYSVTQTVDGCTSLVGTGIATPGPHPTAPVVTDFDNCNSTSTLSTTASGNLLWSTGATTTSIIVSAAGTYSVIQTIDNCSSTIGTGTASPKSTPPAPNVTDVDSCGKSTLTASDYSGALSWNTGATTISITVTTAGTYSVTQTINGCTSSPIGTATASPLTIPPAPGIIVYNNYNCSIGQTALVATGYTGTVHWSNGSTATVIVTSTAATWTLYQIVVYTSASCNSPTTSAVAAPVTTPPTPGVTVVNNCNVTSILSTSATGALSWSTGATTSTITVTTGGTYSVTTTVLGCLSASGTMSATPYTTPSAPVVTVTNNCNVTSTLSTTSGGTLLWSQGGITSTITVSTAGTYSVTTTSVNGCTSASGTGIAAPKSTPSAPGVADTNECALSILSANSYTGTLSWNTGATTSSIDVTVAGTYSVTQTVNGCLSAPGTGIATPIGLSPAPTVTDTNYCNGTSVLYTTASGNLLWAPGGATTSSITVTAAGTYSVTQTVGTCASLPGTAVASPHNTPATPTVTVTNNCGNSVLHTTSAGSLLWNTGATTSSITLTTAVIDSVTTTVNGCISASGTGTAAPLTVPVAPGITVYNNYNCTSGQAALVATGYTGTVHWSNGSTATVIVTSTAATWTLYQTVGTCNSASVTAIAAPGTTPATPTVSVTNACGNSTLSTTAAGSLLWTSGGATTTSITVTAAGSYSVTTTAASGCVSAAGHNTAAPYAFPSAPVVTDVDNCNNTSTLTATSTGILLWSTGATSATITVSSAGPYTVTTTNGNGCTSSPGSGTANPLSPPPVPTVSDSDGCFSTLTVSSYTGSLLWNTGATTASIVVAVAGTYSVTQTVSGCVSSPGTAMASPLTSLPPAVTVMNTCLSSTLSTTATGTLLWNTGATTTSITVSSAGTYSVTRTNLYGCTSASGTGPAAPIALPSTPAVTVNNATCGSSTLSTTSTGLLLWSTGATTSSTTVTAAGTYSVTTTSASSGCTSLSGSGTAAPTPLPATPGITVLNNYNCTSGQAALVATGYTGTVHWSNGSTATVIVTAAAATWTLYQTIGSCNSATTSAIAAPGTTPATPTVSVTNACGSSTLSTTAAGSLLWTSGGATTTSITVTAAGSYSVTTTAASGCVSAAGHNTAAPYAFPSAPVVTDVDNCNNTSTLTTTSTGTLLWSTGATSATITVSSAGPYTVTTTNGNGCTSSPGSGTANPLSPPPAPTVSDSDGCTSLVYVSNTTGTLLWNTGATTTSIVVAVAGTYSVTQTVSGCVSSPGTAMASPLTSLPPAVTVMNTCLSSTLSTTATGTLLWNTGATTTSITVSSAGTYSVTQTNLYGCTSTSGTGTSAPIALPATPAVSVINACGTSTLSTTSTGSLLWSTGATTSAISVTAVGTYSVTTTSPSSGCTSLSGSGTSNPTALPASPVITVYNNYNCASGQAAFTASGYTGTLHWNNGSSASVIVTSTAATWCVYQTVGTCNSATVCAVVTPGTTPATPTVTVTNACGSSTLSTSSTGSLLWTSGGATTTSITVTAAGSYSVTTTAASGCVSAAGHNTAAPYAFPSAPVVTDVDNCNNTSTLTTTSTGTLLWSTGATSATITVSSAGPYTVTTTNGNGCTSSPGSGTANPLSPPPAPTVSDSNGCSSTLTVSSYTGSLLWNTGATTASIVVAVGGTYSVTQTVSGCVSSPGTAMASPLTSLPPAVTVMNTCLSSTLSTTATGTLLWNTGATTTSITVSSAGTYSVTQTNLYGCTSASGTGPAAPIALPSTPAVTVTNACGSSTLSTTSTGLLLWSTGATTSSTTVTAAGTYSVTRTTTCTSLSGTGTAAPLTVPATPVITVYNNYNCAGSQAALTVSGYTGTVHWSNGSTATVIVTATAATWCVYQTVGTCNSASVCAAEFPGKPATPGAITPPSPTAPCASSTVTNPGTYYTYTIAAVNGATSYIWTVPAGFNDSTLTTTWPGLTVTTTNAVAGNITVKASNSCGTSSSASAYAVTFSCREAGTGPEADGMDMVAYPNPAHDKMNVVFNSSSIGTYVLRMFDITGRLVLNKQNATQEGANIIEIDVTNFAKGIYTLSITTDDGSKQLRVSVD